MNSRSIQKLRRKFIFISSLTYFLVIVFMGGCINAVNMTSTRFQIKNVLDYIIENDGEIPNEVTDDYARSFSAEFSHSARYFTVTYGTDGEAKSVNTFHSQYTNAEAEALADQVVDGKRSFGRRGNYYFEKETTDDGTLVVFLNCATQLNSNRRILLMTAYIAIGGLIITVILVNMFSYKVVAPEIENLRRQKQFITNASHELKTPLAVIRANTEVAEMINGESEWTQSTMRQVDRLNGLIQNLVMISRAEEAEDKSLFSEIDVTKAVRETIEPYESLAVQDKKKFIQELDAGVTLTGDESRVRQLASLLIDNAFKYCDDGGTVTVQLTTQKKGKQVKLVMSNTFAEGANVDYSRFFDRFYRADQAHTIDGNEKGGYGIGLSIAESICRQFHGSINVSWKDGVISFTCILQ